MKITLVASGGVAGFAPHPRTNDQTALAPAVANHSRMLVAEAGFYQLPPVAISTTGNDLLQYAISVQNDERRQHVIADDRSATPALLTLIDELMREITRT